MLRLRIAMVALLAVVIGFVVGCGREQKSAGQNGGTDDGAQSVKAQVEDAVADLTISATELYAAYKADSKAADQQFKGKRLAVTGKIEFRENDPNGPQPRWSLILFALKGSSEKNEFVFCYFPWEYERNFYRLDAKTMPPIIGTCEGSVTNNKSGKIVVLMKQCVIPKVDGVKSPYDKGFAEGNATGTAHMREIKVNAQAGRDTIRKMLKTYTDIYNTKAAHLKPGGDVFPSDVDKAKGTVDGYRKAVEASGVN